MVRSCVLTAPQELEVFNEREGSSRLGSEPAGVLLAPGTADEVEAEASFDAEMPVGDRGVHG